MDGDAMHMHAEPFYTHALPDDIWQEGKLYWRLLSDGGAEQVTVEASDDNV